MRTWFFAFFSYGRIRFGCLPLSIFHIQLQTLVSITTIQVSCSSLHYTRPSKRWVVLGEPMKYEYNNHFGLGAVVCRLQLTVSLLRCVCATALCASVIVTVPYISDFAFTVSTYISFSLSHICGHSKHHCNGIWHNTYRRYDINNEIITYQQNKQLLVYYIYGWEKAKQTVVYSENTYWRLFYKCLWTLEQCAMRCNIEWPNDIQTRFS